MPPPDDLIRRLPLPLAQLLRRAHDAKTPQDRHLSAFYLWEAAVKLLGSVAVVEYADRPGPDPRLAERLRVLARPTLGHWWEVIRLLVPFHAESDGPRWGPIAELLFGRTVTDMPAAAALHAALGEVVAQQRGARERFAVSDLFDRLVEYRNREIGHGAGDQRAVEFHERMGRVTLDGVSELLDRLDVTAGRRLAYVNDIRQGEREQKWLALVVELTGEYTRPVDGRYFAREKFDQPSEPLRVYLTGPGERGAGGLTLLHPLVTFDRDANEVFLFNRVKGGTVEYLGYTSGRFREEARAPDPRPVLAAALGLPVGQPPPEPDPTDEHEPLPRTQKPPVRERLGQYELLAEIGRGGIGRVFSGWQPSLGREVAIQVIDDGGNPDRWWEWIKRVGPHLGRLSHPNLVRLLDVLADEGQVALVMELVRGSSLQDSSPFQTPATPEAVRRIADSVRQAAGAAHALHQAGLIHRNIKPRNIRLTPDGRAVLLGLEVIEVPSETAGHQAGTVAYMSPEQGQGDALDARSDVFGLGATLYYCLTGSDPFRMGSLRETREHGAFHTPTSAWAVNTAVPAELAAIVEHSLEKDPARRYPTAAALADDLHRFLAGEPITAARLGRVRRFARAVRRRPAWWLLLLVTTASLAANVGFAVVRGGERATHQAQLRERDDAIEDYKQQLAAATKEKSPFVIMWPAGGSGHTTRIDLTAWSALNSGWPVAAVLALIVLGQAVARTRRHGRVTIALAGQEEATVPPRTDPAAASGPEPATAPPPAPAAARQLPRHDPNAAFSSQTIVLHYPAPIAIPYRRFVGRTAPGERLKQLFATFEMALRYLTYLGLCDLFHCRVRGTNPGDPVAPLPTRQEFNLTRSSVRMTLNQWVQALVHTAEEVGKQTAPFVPELPAACGKDGFLNREVFPWLRNLRIDDAHPEAGQTYSDEEAGRLLKDARPRLERFLQEVGFVRRYPLGFVTGGFEVGEDRVLYQVHSCMGNRVAHVEEAYDLETTARFSPGVPFVVAADGARALYLWPLVLQRMSDKTTRPSLYVFERVVEGAGWLTGVAAAAVDHDDRWEADVTAADWAGPPPGPPADHGWLWNALRNLPAVVPVPPEKQLADGLANSVIGTLKGETLGNYKLLGPIACGGFGTVYDAQDADGRRVAVKVLEVKDGRTQYDQLSREYDRLRRAGADFPGVIRCFDKGITTLGKRAYPWYAMEFAAGGDLGGRLDERRAALGGRLAWDDPARRAEAVAEFAAIVRAVEHLHGLGIVHRDVKPGNVLVMDGGNLRLSDFGLVKELLPAGRPGASLGPGSRTGVVGTRDYMAPEQAKGEAVTPAADVYSLGVVLAELATGERPRADLEVAAGSPIDGDTRLHRLPVPLRDLIVWCTDVKPARRPVDAGYVRLEFERAATRARVIGPPP